MTFYNTFHGTNPAADLILAALGMEPADFGRFRDCYVANGEIAIFTRNGGGNRDCWHEDHEDMGNDRCVHESRDTIIDEAVEATDDEAATHPDWTPLNAWHGTKRFYATGNKVTHTFYMCLHPNSADCACPGCIITHRLPTHPLYLRDEDDEYDPTYATVYFRFPDAYKDALALLDAGAYPTLRERTETLIATLTAETPDETN